jgi:hypothetical protein
MNFERVRGDNFPFKAILKINGVVCDLTDTTAIFTYDEDGTIKTLQGTINTPLNGEVMFSVGDTDFQTVGNFKYDIQSTKGGIRTTHLMGKIKIIDDVSK